MNFTTGQRVRINSGRMYGEIALYVRAEFGQHIVYTRHGCEMAVASVLSDIANNGD